MLDALTDYLKGMNHTVKREDVTTALDHIINNINDDVIPSLDQMIKNSDLTVVRESRLVRTLVTSTNLKAKNGKEFYIRLKAMFVNIVKNNKHLSKIVSKELSEFVTDNSAKAKDVTILKVVQDIGAMSQYIMDINYVILLDNGETDLPKLKLKTVRLHIGEFIKLVNTYNRDFDKTITKLGKVSSAIIDMDDGKYSMLDKLITSTGVNVNLPTASGFIGNPVYHIRMWFVDREVDKYESLKDKKRLIELKLSELKLSESNEHDSSISGQIEYYENKLTKIEEDIRDIEED